MLRLSPNVFLYNLGTQHASLPEGGIALPQVPSKAFGDGTHPTTRLCAGAVDLLCRQKGFRSVLDVGTGTGILARIARARGVPFVAGTDIDPDAIAAAQINVALDSHAVAISISDALPDSWGAHFDLVVGNILEAPLRELAASLARALAPAGILLISGFTPLQVPGLTLAFADAGLQYVSESHLEGWAMLMFTGTQNS